MGNQDLLLSITQLNSGIIQSSPVSKFSTIYLLVFILILSNNKQKPQSTFSNSNEMKNSLPG